ESEFENQGFSLSRRAGHTADWKLLADHTTHSELEGQGSSTSRTDYAFVDGSAKPDVKYDYRLTDIPYSAVAKTTTIVLEDVRLMIDGFKLFANYPNPFNPSTHIAYQIARQTDVQIRITDIQGREIRSWEVRSMQPGTHETLWEGLNSAGQPVGAGIYFATVQAGSETHSQKMLLIK
ncbi:MAG: FlgD immunoglobulin-like domain containing protein, partial [Candidatus Marinimicrobia bacterium]|nr:FlgD immunoglobulin-like domain containing protein [Candidatus Neomarinimicrobiota bacterium]